LPARAPSPRSRCRSGRASATTAGRARAARQAGSDGWGGSIRDATPRGLTAGGRGLSQWMARGGAQGNGEASSEGQNGVRVQFVRAGREARPGCTGIGAEQDPEEGRGEQRERRDRLGEDVLLRRGVLGVQEPDLRNVARVTLPARRHQCRLDGGRTVGRCPAPPRPTAPHTTTTLSGPIWFDSVRFGYLGVVVIAIADVDGRAEVDDARERTVGLL